MASVCSTPKTHTYDGDSTLIAPKCDEHFVERRFVKPINRHELTLNIGSNLSIVIKLQPTQHWMVEKYDEKYDTVTLSFKYSVITLPMVHAKEMFKDYPQNACGNVMHRIY